VKLFDAIGALGDREMHPLLTDLGLNVDSSELLDQLFPGHRPPLGRSESPEEFMLFAPSDVFAAFFAQWAAEEAKLRTFSNDPDDSRTSVKSLERHFAVRRDTARIVT
jgi:hypothetical protein